MSEGLPLIDPNLAKIFQQSQVQPGAPLFQPPGTPLQQAEQARTEALTKEIPAKARREAMGERREAEKWELAKTEAGEERERGFFTELFGLGGQANRPLAAQRAGQIQGRAGIPMAFDPKALLGPPAPQIGGELPSVPGMEMLHQFGPQGFLTGTEARTPAPETATRGVFQPVEGPGGEFITSLIDPKTGRQIK